MESCTAAAGDGLPPSALMAFLRDAKLVVLTALMTCLAIASYNFYLHCRAAALAKETAKLNKSDDEYKDRLLATKRKRAKTKMLENFGSMAASLAHIEGMNASGNFLSAVFGQMWEHLNIAISNSVKDALEPTLKDLPVPLHFVRLDLGDVPIRMANMFIHRVDLMQRDGAGQKEKQAGIQIDVDVVWDGNCDVMLQATLTKSAKVTFGVKQIKLSGRMHILLSPLTTDIPVISAVQYGFTNPPEIELKFTGAVQSVTSKLGFVQNALVSVIDSTLASMLVLPQRMVMPMDLGSYDYLDTYQPPVGMVRVTALSGRGFKVLQKYLLKDIPDLYCKISLGASASTDPPFRTSTKVDCLTPSWADEHCDFILYDMDQKVYVEVFDADTPPNPDDKLGEAEIRVRDLFRHDGTKELQLKMDGETTDLYVTLGAELFHLSDKLTSLTAPEYEGKNQLCGLVTIIVTKAFDIQIPREDAATYVKVVYGENCRHEKTFYTGAVVDYPGIDSLNPMYDCVFHVPLTAPMLRKDCLPSSPNASTKGSASSFSESGGDKRSFAMRSMAAASTRVLNVTGSGSQRPKKARNNITFTLVDGDGANGTKGHGDLGKMTVSYEELVAAYRHTITETRPLGDTGAKLEFRAILSGMQSEEEKLTDESFREDPFAPAPPQSLFGGIDESDGVTVRITCVRGRGFQIRKRRIGKKDDVPDVYCTLHLSRGGGRQPQSPSADWRTPTIKDDTMPQWHDSRDFEHIHPARAVVRVDVWDDNKGKDDFLGRSEFSVEKLLRKRSLELALLEDGAPTKMYVTLMCIKKETVEDISGSCHTAVNGGAGPRTPLLNVDHDDAEAGDVVAPLRPSSASSSLHKAQIYNAANDEDDQSVNSTSSTSSRWKKLKGVTKASKRLKGSKKKSGQ
ncbi:hypothetical protein ACHAXT_009514 [Thalassiosira profunda]